MVKIEMLINGPWITRIKMNDKLLNYEEAQEIFDWLMTECNTTQYNEE